MGTESAICGRAGSSVFNRFAGRSMAAVHSDGAPGSDTRRPRVTSTPLARYGAMWKGARRERLRYRQEVRHSQGHDRVIRQTRTISLLRQRPLGTFRRLRREQTTRRGGNALIARTSQNLPGASI